MPRNQTTWEVLGEYESSSSDVIYEVRKGHDGVVYCTCPAWRMKQGKASCKHLDEWRRENLQRPTGSQRDTGLRIQDVRAGDVIEVNCRGDVFLLKVGDVPIDLSVGKLVGHELLDAGEAPCSRGGERIVDFRDVMRVVIRG